MFLVGILFLAIIIIDFYIKVNVSNNSSTVGTYLSKYASQNLFSISNIYVVTCINIFLGFLASIIFYLSYKSIKRKVTGYLLIATSVIISLLNLFSLM